MSTKSVVLLVEDDPALGPTTRDLLAARGYDIELSDAVEEAFDRLRLKHFDVILLDLSLPDFRGETLTHRLRRIRTEPPKIIIFSALPIEELKIAMTRTGAVGIVQKPATADNLVQAIDRAMNGKR